MYHHKHMNEKYRKIHADMHFQWSAYLHVSACICLYFIPENLMTCTRYIQICTSSSSAYLYVSACICLYFVPEYMWICTEYMHQVRVIYCADCAARRPRIITYQQHQSVAQPMQQQVWFILTGARSLHVRRAVTAAAQAQAKKSTRLFGSQRQLEAT